MYVVFIRDKNQRIYSKTSTTNKNEALKNFANTIYREELYGRRLIAIFEHKKSIKIFHRFNTDKDLFKIKNKLRELEKILQIENQIVDLRQAKESSKIINFWTNYKFPT